MSERPAHPALIALAALVAVQLLLALLWVRPGPLSIDEVLYQWMARSAADGHLLTVANGYEELPSPELATIDYMRTVGGRLTIQYPVLFPLLAAPLYAWLGPLGLFLLNAVAFAGVLVLTWHIGARLLGGSAALIGTTILAGGTFAWDYAMAAWPHMLALLLELAAFDLTLTALRAERDTRRAAPARAALLAGALLGIAVGVRRDAVFFLPVAGLALLFANPPRMRSLAALALGALPPLATLGWLNGLRWGTWSPLSYGQVEQGYRLLGLVGALGLVGLAVLAAPPVQRRVVRAVAERPKAALLALAAIAFALFMIPATGERMLRIVDGVESLLFDLRGSATEVAGGRAFYFAVLYAGGLKKSLLQSLPWLPLLIVTGWLAWREPARRRACALLFLPVALYIGIQVFFNRHGGMSLNLRYYLPALPFLSLLAASGFDTVWRASAGKGDPGGGRGRMIASATPVAAALLGWLVLRPTTFVQPRAAAFAVLDAPILIAALTTAAAVVWLAAPTNRLPDGRRPRATALAVLATGSAAFVWSACLAFDYDARWSRHVRADNLRRSIEVAARITPHSLLFGQWPDWHGTVPEFVDDVLVAYPSVDQYRDFQRLAVHHLGAGRRVYAALDPPTWRALEQGGHLAGLELRVLDDTASLTVELRRAPE